MADAWSFVTKSDITQAGKYYLTIFVAHKGSSRLLKGFSGGKAGESSRFELYASQTMVSIVKKPCKERQDWCLKLNWGCICIYSRSLFTHRSIGLRENHSGIFTLNNASIFCLETQT